VTAEVLNYPEVLASDHVKNVGQFTFLCANRDLSDGLNGHFGNLVRFSVVDLLQRPPLNKAVMTSCDKLTVLK
jgi:hypothetical protein